MDIARINIKTITSSYVMNNFSCRGERGVLIARMKTAFPANNRGNATGSVRLPPKRENYKKCA